MSRADEQAFPVAGMQAPNDNFIWPTPGLTIREHFAAIALPAVVAACAKDTLKAGEIIDELFARKAYRLADALIAEGAKPVAPDPRLAEAREVISNLRDMVKQIPEFNHHKYDSFGARVNSLLAELGKVTP